MRTQRDSSKPVVIITGAASGIGRSCAAEMKARGWLVAGFDLVESPSVDLSLCLDVSKTEEVRLAVQDTANTLGQPRGVVSGAGFVDELFLEDLTDELISQMLSVHLGGFINLVNANLPHMSQTGGAFVAISSEMALVGGESAAHYIAAKGAITGTLRSLAVELADLKISVNGVAPGPTDTQMLTEESIWRSEPFVNSLLTGKLVQPSEIARAVAFLLENPAGLTGEIISPNAGTAL
jgi:2-hydroxycyclohexanecarboxyl-CoA dehydrogenase